MIKVLAILLVVWLIGAWYIILSSTKRCPHCPHCGGRMDKVGNNYLCRDCYKLYHMNIFGKFKEEEQ
jgi:tRNA(Ile2) C34 agmatinyltransferase TiaS